MPLDRAEKRYQVEIGANEKVRFSEHSFHPIGDAKKSLKDAEMMIRIFREFHPKARFRIKEIVTQITLVYDEKKAI